MATVRFIKTCCHICDDMLDELMRLGMGRNEARVYLALLDTGRTNAGAIIKKTKLHRNIVYDNLEKLIDKGLVSFVLIKNIKNFEIASSKDLEDWIEEQKKEVLEKEKTLEKILPEIDKRRTEIENKQEATIFKGKKGLINVLDMTTKTKELFVFGTGWGLKETTGTYNDLWYVKLKKNKVKVKILLPKTRRAKYPLVLNVRYLDEEHTIPSTTAVFDDKVLTIIWGKDPTAVLIKSEDVAKLYKNYFKVLWKIVK